MRKKRGHAAEKSRKYRERQAEKGKKLLRVWVSGEEKELVKWTLQSENCASLRAIMAKMKEK